MLQASKFPQDYAEAVRQAQSSTKAALGNGEELIEIEFPASGLSSVSGAESLLRLNA